MKYVFLFCLFAIELVPACSQTATEFPDQNKKENKPAFAREGTYFFYWGYNRSWYANSDIHFISEHCDFTLYDVRAKDRQSNFNLSNYFLMSTIPQFNARLGYFIKDHWAISLGYDHMKYVMVSGQIVTIKGRIDTIETQKEYAGIYTGEKIRLSPYFLSYEHTNGLNYFSFDGEYSGNIWSSDIHNRSIAYSTGLSLGILCPRSDVDVFNIDGENKFHVAGFGYNLIANIRFQMNKHFFISWQNRIGTIVMNDVLIFDNFKARQTFSFYQAAVLFGFSSRLSGKP